MPSNRSTDARSSCGISPPSNRSIESHHLQLATASLPLRTMSPAYKHLPPITIKRYLLGRFLIGVDIHFQTPTVGRLKSSTLQSSTLTVARWDTPTFLATFARPR